MRGDVADRLSAELQRWVVVVGTGMLDEEQGRGYWLTGFLAHNVAVDEGLQVVVAVVFDAGGVEDGLYVGEILLSATTGFIVNYADTLFASLRIGNA